VIPLLLTAAPGGIAGRTGICDTDIFAQDGGLGGVVTGTEWAEVYDPSWRPSFTQNRQGLEIHFVGSCPRCTHGMTFNVTPAIPPSAGVATRGAPEEFTMYCACGHPHEGHPDGDNSCGAYWPYEADLA